MAKFYNINPQECSIEDLKAAIAQCNGKKEYYGALEQGCKKFINSVYGALGSAYYVCANTAIAESVTLQGQDLIKFSARKVNYLVGNLWTKLNEIIKPTMYILDNQTNEVIGVIHYDSPQEDLDEWMNILSEHGNEYSIYISNKTIGIGYWCLVERMCKKEDGTKKKYLNDSENGEINYLRDKTITVGQKEQTGVCFDANPISFEYIFNRLNIYRRIGYEMLEHDENFDIDSFVENCATPIIFPESTRKVGDDGEMIDTLQCYGDSCVGDTWLSVDRSNTLIPHGPENITIEDLFNEYKDTLVNIRGKEYVTPNANARCNIRNFYDGNIVNTRIAHIVRHKNTKRIFKVTGASGNSVMVTEDHSLVMFNIKTGEVKSVVTKNLNNFEDFRLIVDLGEDGYSLDPVSGCEEIYKEFEYVYDIEVASVNLDRHNFFGNNILLHNTDSVSKDSIIITTKHPEGITIEEFYNENKDNFAGNTLAGHESVATLDSVLNWFNGLYYGEIERIIRHKVTKDKWRLKTTTGKEVVCTGDHSLIVNRNNEQTIVSPKDIDINDKVIVRDGSVYELVEIESCEQIGQFEDEYVYDIEMKDETHTFICNDILVHNSAYITLQPLIESCKIPAELATHFILAFNDHVMADYLNLQFEAYSKKFNCPKNLENFELEKIARALLMQRKKKYVMDIAWTDSHIFYDPLKKLVFKGVEAVKGESSQFVRKEQKEFVKWVIDNINQGKDLKYPEIVGHIKTIKDRFMMATPDDICVTKSLSDYDKYIVNDKGEKVVYAEDVVVPFHAKASSWYNNLLYTRERKYRSRYDIIRKGDKVRIYYVKDPRDDEHKTFAYLPGSFPVEFAPPIDMNEMFTKLILDPLNRYVEALGYNPIGSKLTYKTSLF